MNINELDEETLDKVKSGTTTVGFQYKDGVIIGTESQASAGYMVASKQAQKLFEINNYSAATISGGVSDAQYVIDQISALSRLREVKKGRVPEPKYIANITRNILYGGRSYYMAMIIVGGYSMMEEKGKLYGIDLLGTLFEGDNFLSFGSGSTYALGVLESDWEEGLSEEEGLELMKTTISSSRKRDIASGYDIQLCVVNKDGFKQIQ